MKGKKHMKKLLRLFVLVVLLVILSTGIAFAGRKIYSYHNAPDGTPLIITDEKANIVWQADYKPFGEEQSVTGTIENNKRFISKEKDAETGLIYINHRYLDPKTGRFITPDPIGPVNPWNSKTNYEMLLNPQRLNPYAYGLNNPYRYIDENGKWPTEVHNKIIATAFSGGKYNLSSAAIAALQRGSRDTDTRQYQDTAHSYMHAMTAAGQSPQDAERMMNNFITLKVSEYKSLMSQGKTDAAYESLGMAMHPIMDSTSPAHEGFQTWNSPYTHPIDALEHKAQETVEKFNSEPQYLQKSIDLLRNFYDVNK